MDRYPVLVVGAKPEPVRRLSAVLGDQQVRVADDARAARAALQKGHPATAVVAIGATPSQDSLHLVRELAESVSYAREGPYNVLRAVLVIPDPNSETPT